MSTPTDTVSAPSTQEVVDRLSLEQALLDVEVANARVIDLTARLAEASAELQQLRAQVASSGGAAHRPSSLVDLPLLAPLRRVARAVLPAHVRHRLLALLR